MGCVSAHRIAEELRALNPPDGLSALQALPAVARAIVEENRRSNPDRGEIEHQIVLVALGWSDLQDRPFAVALDTGTRIAFTRPGELREIGGLATPEVALPHPLGSGRLNPTDHGREVFNLQRAALDLNADGTWTSIVGGFAEVVTVSRAGLATRRLIDWPEDVVGSKIMT